MKRNMDVAWSYSGENGPEYWHTLCDWYRKGAEYPYQSPIHLNHLTAQSPQVDQVDFFYRPENFTEKEFKNTIHFVPFDCQSFLRFQGVDYHLTDIHFHLPSEHLIDDQQEDVEFHLVHMDDAGNNLVVGVLFQLVAATDLTDFFSAEINWDLKRHRHRFDPSLLLPAKKSHFHYVGSLTTPPTVGPINWFVFDHIRQLPRNFVETFKEEILPGNNRPLQDVKERPIYYFGG